MQQKKQILLRCMALVMGLILGISASFFIWYIKSYFDNPNSSVSKAEAQKFIKSDFWEKVAMHFETSNTTFLDNYMNIYTTYKLMDNMDDALSPYYEKYGYTTVLKSGLESKSKLANIYCIEKCCSIWGDDLFDNKEILSSLNSVYIDKELITDADGESFYITLASDRLNLLKSLIDESYSSDKIIKNKLKTRMAWFCDATTGSYKLRIYDNGVFYTLDNLHLSEKSAMHFVSDDTIVLNDTSKYIIHLKNTATVYDIQKVIKDTINEPDTVFEVLSVEATNENAYATFAKFVDNQSSFSIENHSITLNLLTGKAEITS